jgi:hypothetical protein
MFSYFTRKVTESIFDRMILKGFAICNVVERFSYGEKTKATPEVTYTKGHVNV